MATFRILDSITDPGNPLRPNDDSSGGNGCCAFVIDGATGLGESFIDPDGSDAAWLARFAKGCFEELVVPETSIASVVATVNRRVKSLVDELQHGCAQPRWNLPIAGFQLVRFGNDRLTTYGLGDCRLFALAADGEVLEASALPQAHRAEQEAARGSVEKAGGLATLKSLTNHPETLEALRRSRARHNSPGASVWTLGVEPEAACHVVAYPVTAALPMRGIVCTDGFAALVDQYGRHDIASLISTAADAGLGKLVAELRQVEQLDDPDGRLYPRFKVSDDATAVLFEVG